jgi:S-DNA-T family DNA segregation ATPase FtsK/SpoIIIE
MRPELVALTMFVVAALFIVGLLTWSSGSQNIVGVAGGVLARLFGVAAWLVPALLLISAIPIVTRQSTTLRPTDASRWASPAVPVGLALLLLGAMGFIHLFVAGQPAAELGQGGGYVGLAISTFLSDYLTPAGAGIVLAAVILIGFMLAFGVSLAALLRAVGRPTVAAGRFAQHTLGGARMRLSETRQTRPASASREPVRINGRRVTEDTSALPLPDSAATSSFAPPFSDRDATPVIVLGDEKPSATGALPLAPDTPKAKTKPEPVINLARADQKAETGPHEPIQSPLGYIWHLPPISLLKSISEVKVSQVDIKTKIKVIEDTLQSFKVEATVREVNTGPAVTQFAIEPGVGVRVNRITTLDKDLALALAASDIRIEAPIPGQSRVGIEVPNNELQVVGLRGIVEAAQFANGKGRLKIAMGRDTHGLPVVTDLAKLPHLLVAGSTGSGKSVFLNSMVIGFLMQFTPDDLRMLMIDPKRVELTPFNGIPHLVRPVVTDIRLDKEQTKGPAPKPKDNERERPMTAVEALKWALWEMERRYKLFAKGRIDKDGMSRIFRNIEQYREFSRENPDVSMEHIPYIVIIIDELADLMLTAPEEVETSLCRLAQLARATGIHLVVATQRPSVDVVTGLIKANFPARIAFAVTSQVDSKVILDTPGAEKLLGRGDMLYTASDESRPIRIQGTFVSDKEESQKVVDFWRRQLPSEDDVKATGVIAPLPPMQMPDWLGKGDPDEDSELVAQAIELVKTTNFVSTSMLQRKLRVGYTRAARLLEQMEEMGLISQADTGNKGRPREVLLGAPDSRSHPQSFNEIDED